MEDLPDHPVIRWIEKTGYPPRRAAKRRRQDDEELYGGAARLPE